MAAIEVGAGMIT